MRLHSAIGSAFKRAATDFLRDRCTRLAAALSYYTIFSLPALLVLVVLVTGLLVDPQVVEARLVEEIRSLVGAEGAEQIRTMLQNANRPGSGGAIAWIIGIGALILGSTGAFVQLQTALNTAWEVKPAPGKGALRGFFMKRLLSIGMMLTVGFLLLVSLVLSALISSTGSLISGSLPPWMSGPVLQSFELGASVVLFTLLFAAIFVVLPDAQVAWRDVWIGAATTSMLFVAGKFLIGFYLSRSDPGNAFGAAGSLALVLAWVYYSALIFFFGAEFTQAWADQRGRKIVPEKGAISLAGPTGSSEPGR